MMSRQWQSGMLVNFFFIVVLQVLCSVCNERGLSSKKVFCFFSLLFYGSISFYLTSNCFNQFWASIWLESYMTFLYDGLVIFIFCTFWLMICRFVQEDLWLSAFPIGTEVCSHPYLHLFCSVYVSGAPLDIAYRLNCALCLAFNNLYNLALSSAVGIYW